MEQILESVCKWSVIGGFGYIKKITSVARLIKKMGRTRVEMSGKHRELGKGKNKGWGGLGAFLLCFQLLILEIENDLYERFI